MDSSLTHFVLNKHILSSKLDCFDTANNSFRLDWLNNIKSGFHDRTGGSTAASRNRYTIIRNLSPAQTKPSSRRKLLPIVYGSIDDKEHMTPLYILISDKAVYILHQLYGSCRLLSNVLLSHLPASRSNVTGLTPPTVLKVLML